MPTLPSLPTLPALPAAAVARLGVAASAGGAGTATRSSLGDIVAERAAAAAEEVLLRGRADGDGIAAFGRCGGGEHTPVSQIIKRGIYAPSNGHHIL